MGGTRLNDVRFLPLQGGKWRRFADLNVARWGRPSVGIIGGKITVIGGWDGVKALSTLEIYNERTQSWATSRKAKISTERRWAAGTQVSHTLFPTCVQKRSWYMAYWDSLRLFMAIVYAVLGIFLLFQTITFEPICDISGWSLAWLQGYVN